MYIAMNHFRVAPGKSSEFEERWRTRKSYLDEVPGFVSFHLVRGKDDDDGSHAYASHTVWESRQSFVDWTHSEAFRAAHGSRSSAGDLLLQHPVFRGWSAVDL